MTCVPPAPEIRSAGTLMSAADSRTVPAVVMDSRLRNVTTTGVERPPPPSIRSHQREPSLASMCSVPSRTLASTRLLRGRLAGRVTDSAAPCTSVTSALPVTSIRAKPGISRTIVSPRAAAPARPPKCEDDTAIQASSAARATQPTMTNSKLKRRMDGSGWYLTV